MTVPESVYSVCVWHRRSPRGRWLFWASFPSGVEAAQAISAAKRRGVLVETLTVLGGSNHNEKKGRRK